MTRPTSNNSTSTYSHILWTVAMEAKSSSCTNSTTPILSILTPTRITTSTRRCYTSPWTT